MVTHLPTPSGRSGAPSAPLLFPRNRALRNSAFRKPSSSRRSAARISSVIALEVVAERLHRLLSRRRSACWSSCRPPSARAGTTCRPRDPDVCARTCCFCTSRSTIAETVVSERPRFGPRELRGRSRRRRSACQPSARTSSRNRPSPPARPSPRSTAPRKPPTTWGSLQKQPLGNLDSSTISYHSRRNS